MIIQKGNAPLIDFSFKQRSGSVVTIPTDTTRYKVWIHDSVSLRQGSGTIQGINTSAGTCQYQSATTDWVNAGVVTAWCTVDLGEPEPRTFEPQKILIEDPSQA